MLERLRARALLRVDHEQEQVDAGRAGDHRAHEPLVTRDVDERSAPSVRKLERRVAEVDRDAALPAPPGRRSVSLPVRARTSHVLPWSMWPAVPTVSGIGLFQRGAPLRRKLGAAARQGRAAGQATARRTATGAHRLARARASPRRGSSSPSSAEIVPRARWMASSSSSLRRQVRSGSTIASRTRSIVRSPSAVRSNGSCTLTYQPQCLPSGNHDTQTACQSHGRQSCNVSTSQVASV